MGGGGGSGALTRGNIKALVAGVDGSMFVAYKNGVVDKYTEWGRWVTIRVASSDLGWSKHMYPSKDVYRCNILHVAIPAVLHV